MQCNVLTIYIYTYTLYKLYMVIKHIIHTTWHMDNWENLSSCVHGQRLVTARLQAGISRGRLAGSRDDFGRGIPCRFPMKNNELKEDVTMKEPWKKHGTIWTKHETYIRNYEKHMRQHEQKWKTTWNNMKKTWTNHETTMNKPWKHVQTWKKQIRHTQRLNTQCFT